QLLHLRMGPGPGRHQGLRGDLRLQDRVGRGRGRRRAAEPPAAGRQEHQGRSRARPRHQPHGGGDGDRPVRAARLGSLASEGADRLDRPGVRAVRLGLLRRRLRQDQGAEAADQPEGADRRRSQPEDRAGGSALEHAGPRPDAVGQEGLRRQGRRRLDQVAAAHSHHQQRLDRGLCPVHPGRGADGVELHDLAGLSHHRGEDGQVCRRTVRRRPLHAGRGRRPYRRLPARRVGRKVPRLHDLARLPGPDSHDQLDVSGNPADGRAAKGIRPARAAEQVDAVRAGGGCGSSQAVDRRVVASDQSMIRRLAPGALTFLLLGIVIGGAFAGLLRAAGTADYGAFRHSRYTQRVVGFTIWQALLSMLLSVGPAILVARALARRPSFPGRALLLRLFGLPLVLPTLVGILGIVAIYGQSGLFNRLLVGQRVGPRPFLYSLPGILIAHAFFNLPLATRLLLPVWSAIPGETWRLATQLGMRSWQLFRLIEWPLLRQVLPGGGGIVFMLCFTSFAVVLTLGGGPANSTIEVALYQAVRFEFDLGKAVQLALLQVAICGVLVAAGQRFVRDVPLTPTAQRPQDRP